MGRQRIRRVFSNSCAKMSIPPDAWEATCATSEKVFLTRAAMAISAAALCVSCVFSFHCVDRIMPAPASLLKEYYKRLVAFPLLWGSSAFVVVVCPSLWLPMLVVQKFFEA